MKLIAGNFYHIYNQGNRRQQLFFKEEHYLRFIEMVKKYVVPNAEVMAYCLMPNHFHFLVQATDQSVTVRKQGNIMTTELSNGFRMLQSAYAQTINSEQKEFGSLFKQKAQAKEITDDLADLLNVFCYIHQNPTKAGLVSSLSDWKYSSFLSFIGNEKDSFVDIDNVLKLLNIQQREIVKLLETEVDEKLVRKFF